MCELSQVSSCVAVVLTLGYSCAQDLSGEPWCPVMGGSPAGSLPSEEEQAMGALLGFSSCWISEEGWTFMLGTEGAMCDTHNLPR